MRLWTIQPVTVWEQIRDRGEARVDPALWTLDGYTPCCYDWLRGQLEARLAGYSGGYPWWCYCKKPDLRSHGHGFLSGGRDQVRLELEIDPARVSIFRIWAWNIVYCGRYLGSHRQTREWKGRRYRSGISTELRDSELGEPWRTEVEQSWERVFTALPDRHADPWMPPGQEAVLEVIRRQDVRRVDHFQTTYDSFEDYRSRAPAFRRRKSPLSSEGVTGETVRASG